MALVTPAALTLAAVGLNLALGARSSGLAAAGPASDLPTRFLFILLFIGLGEEPGWRGFALPRLQARFTALGASLFLAGPWAVWHLPLFGPEIRPEQIAPFVIGLAASCVFQTWLANRSGGSVLLQMLYHATVNTVGAGWLFHSFAGPDLTRLWWLYAGCWAALATGLALVAGPARLGRAEASSTHVHTYPQTDLT